MMSLRAVWGMTQSAAAMARIRWCLRVTKGTLRLRLRGGTLTVTDLNTQTVLGVDAVSGVETLSFNDGDLTVTAAQDGYVTLTGTGPMTM